MADTETNEVDLSTVKTIYCNGLFPADYTEENLAALFKDCGTVVETTLLRRGRTGELKNFGFVQFETPAAAMKAVQEKNNIVFHEGARLGVVLSTSSGKKARKEPAAIEEIEENPTLFVRKLGFRTRRKQLSEAFESFGTIVSCRVSQRGYGFVEFESLEIAKKALEAMNGKSINDREIAISYAKPRPDRPEKKEESSPEKTEEKPAPQTAGDEEKKKKGRKPRQKLFLKNLSKSVEEDELKSFLETFGEVRKLKILEKEDRLIAYVTMGDGDSAKSAIDSKTGVLQDQEFNIYWAPSFNRRRRRPKKAD